MSEENGNTASGGIEVKESQYVFGIDLGTSNSCISYYKRQCGKTIPVDGNPVCPSIITVLKNGEIIVGRQARGRLVTDPENTVASIKREMGNEAWPPKSFEGLPGKEYSPADISSMILDKLKSAAQDYSNDKDFGEDLGGGPKRVVICVPANFNEAAKRATLEAGRLSELDVVSLLEEPCAAALAYGFDRERDQTIMVYDLGGGTFDVAILEVVTTASGPASFRFRAKEGVPVLGGDDFDAKIMELAAAKLMAESGVDILDDKKDQGISKRSLREAQQKLKEASENAKIELTLVSSAVITLPNLIKDEGGNVHSLEFEITKEQFEEAIRPLILQSKEAVERALQSAGMEMSDIARIILVGGSTRVPLVRTMLTEMFGHEPYSDENPDTVVSRGAAIYGELLLAPSEHKEVVFYNIVTHHLGIETGGGGFACLIEKNAEIPPDALLTVSSDRFRTPRDDMGQLAIRVYQADREVQSVRDEAAVCIGEFHLKGIPRKPAGVEVITVEFSIDQQNLLKVKARSSGSEENLDIQRT